MRYTETLVARSAFPVLKIHICVRVVYCGSEVTTLHSRDDRLKYEPDIGCSEW